MTLPGEAAQLEMAAMERISELKKLADTSKNAKEAATMMLLYPKNGETYFVLIIRKKSKGKHSGQIAFPGGRAEASDKDFAETALRETEEEVGVPVADQELILPGTPIYIPPSNFMVRPFLGYSQSTPTFVPQESEVNGIIEVPLVELMDDTRLSTKVLSTSYLEKVEVPCYILQDQIVWGATAMMLNEFKKMFKDLGL